MKKALAMLLAVLMIFSLVACGQNPVQDEIKEPVNNDKPVTPESNDEPKAEEIVLTYWTTNSSLSKADQELPQEEWLLTKQIEAFEEAHPGVTVEVVHQADAGAIPQMFKAAAMTDDCPDIVEVYSANPLFELEDLLVDLTPYISAEDKELINAWEPLTVGFGSGAVLAYPNGGNSVCGFYYNKQILNACGLDYDTNPPADLDAFMNDLYTIKEKGYLPIYATDEGWGASYLYAFAAWWPQISGGAAVANCGFGVEKFAEDEGFLKSVEVPVKMYADGLINEDFASAADGMAKFISGEAAFLGITNGKANALVEALGIENIGFIAPPSPAEAVTKNAGIGGVGSGIAVSKTCEHPELAVELLSWLNNKENHTAMCINKGKLPYRSDVTAEDINIEAGTVYEQLYTAAQNYVFWVDNSLHPDVNAELAAYMSQAIIGKISVEDLATTLDSVAATVE